ncbi:hypothetical protein HOLleu_09693 [Holothuria leucospilota]|uniref:Uncharacterized protein n=1 Tax=Holothuria leucospilota TaxID=206669 RepID=A0A9Q1CDA1_HOLLE|nr:hypothetical protein HOLleu_09693 [Holothuria leucospilota]
MSKKDTQTKLYPYSSHNLVFGTNLLLLCVNGVHINLGRPIGLPLFDICKFPVGLPTLLT